jgi:hypothetical protein
VTATLVDSNVLLDIFTEDPERFTWSSGTLEQRAEESVSVINRGGICFPQPPATCSGGCFGATGFK